MTYVNGAVVAVKTANKQVYGEMSEAMAALFKKQGALHVFDGWGTDVPPGELTSFPMAVKCADDETVVFSFIVWPSKAAGEAGMNAVMADTSLQAYFDNPPFDGSRMIFGGFEALYEG
jgi:uncharacterized protein YbaA (DUF1428 family)